MAEFNFAAEEERVNHTGVLPAAGMSGWSFYQWRKRLATNPPVQFALVETREASQQGAGVVELLLSGGDRLQIMPGVDAATLRTVLAVLRERQ